VKTSKRRLQCCPLKEFLKSTSLRRRHKHAILGQNDRHEVGIARQLTQPPTFASSSLTQSLEAPLAPGGGTKLYPDSWTAVMTWPHRTAACASMFLVLPRHSGSERPSCITLASTEPAWKQIATSKHKTESIALRKVGELVPVVHASRT